MKTLRTAALVVGAVALIVTTAGAAIPAFAAFTTAATGLSMAAIGAIGTLATTFATLTAKKPKPTIGGSATEFKADPNAGVPYMIGRTAHGGNIVDRETWGADNKYQGFAIVFGGGGPYEALDQFLVDRAPVTFAADAQANGAFHSYMWLNSQGGAAPATNLQTAVPGWAGWSTPGKKLSGLAAALWVLKFDKTGKKFAGGVPQPLAVWKGARVYDPRLDSTYPGGSGPCRPLVESTYVYSENPYCHGVTWALGRWQNGKRVLGIGMPATSIDWPAWVDAMNVADANAWKVGGTVYSVDDKWNVLKLMCQAGGGEPMRHGALLSVTVDAPKVSILTITSDDLVGAGKVSGTQSRRDRINTIIPKVRSEAHGWQVVPLDPVTSATYVAEDGAPRTRELEMPLVQHKAPSNQAAQLAAYTIAQGREFPISLTLRTRFMGLKPGDAVTITVDELGLESRLAVVTQRALDPGSGDVSLELRSETTAKHAFCLGRTAFAPPTPALGPNVDLSSPPPPLPGAWAAAPAVFGFNGEAPVIIFTGEADNAFTDSVTFWSKLVGADDSTYVAEGTVSPDTLRFVTYTAANTSYTVAVSYQVRGVPTARTVIGNVTTGGITATDLVGAGDLAYQDTVVWGSDVDGRPASLVNLRPDGRLIADNISYVNQPAGSSLENLRPAEIGANQTETRQALTISNQAAWATYSGLQPANVAGQVSNLSTGGVLSSIAAIANRRLTLLHRDDGATAVTETAVVTSLGQALTVQNQAAWATYTGLTPSNVAGQVSNLNTSGILSGLTAVGDRRLTLLRREDGSTAVTEAAVVTNLGQALTIANQGDLATQSRASLGFGENAVVDSEFSRALAAYVVGGATADNGAQQPAVAKGMNYPGYTGNRQVFYAWVQTGGATAWAPNGRYYDALSTRGIWNGGTLDDLKRYGLPVKNGDRVFYRARIARQNCNVRLMCLLFDKAGTYLNAGNDVLGGRAGGGANGDPANFDVVGNVFDVNHANAAYAQMVWRMESISLADPFMFTTEPAMGLAAAGQTALPPYSPGRSDPLASAAVDITGPAAIEIPADYLGAISPSVYPRQAIFDARLNGVSQFNQPGVTWSATLLSGNVGFTSSTSDARLYINVTSWSADAKIRITANAGGGSKTYDLPVNRIKAPPPSGGAGGGGSNPGTTATRSIANVASTSYSGVQAGPVTIKAGTAGVVTASISSNFDRSGDGAAGCYAKAQIRSPGGTWVDMGGEQANQVNAVGGYDNSAGYIDRTFTYSGLTAGADYECQLLVRSNAGGTTLFFDGAFVATGS